MKEGINSSRFEELTSFLAFLFFLFVMYLWLALL